MLWAALICVFVPELPVVCSISQHCTAAGQYLEPLIAAERSVLLSVTHTRARLTGDHLPSDASPDDVPGSSTAPAAHGLNLRLEPHSFASDGEAGPEVGMLWTLWMDTLWLGTIFLPGMSLGSCEKQLAVAGLTVALSSVWFLIYFRFVFRSDKAAPARRPGLWGESKSLGADVASSAAFGSALSSKWTREEEREETPDMVLVFPNPGFVSSAADGADNSFVTATEIEIVIGSDAGRSGISSPMRHSMALVSSAQRGDSHSANIPRSAARSALLRDIYERLPLMGFEVSAFRSSSNGEVLVAVCLRDLEVVEQYLTQEDMPLRLKRDVAGKLGVDQPRDEPESSPPLCRYDPGIIARLHACAPQIGNNVQDVYEHYPEHVSVAPQGTPLKHSDRYRIIVAELARYVNLEAAKQHGLLNDFFITHNRQQLKSLRHTWSNPARLFDATFVQPVTHLRVYFGSRLAFIFSWNALYCKALLALAPLAVVYELAMLRFNQHLTESRGDVDIGTRGGNHLLGFGIVLVIWATIASNLSRREEAFLVRAWDIKPDDEVDRPGFRGELGPSPVDKNGPWEKQYPAGWFLFWKFFAGTVTALCCISVGGCMFCWRTFFKDNPQYKTLWGLPASSVAVSIQIKVFEFLYNHIAELLVHLENHKEEDSHYSSYVWKQFTFQSVNAYGPFFFMMLTGWSEHGCGDEGCIAKLRQLMSVSFVILSAARVAHVAVSAVSGVAERRRWRASGGQSFVEEQSKYAGYGDREQIEGMMQLCTALGSMLLFGAACPVVVPLCFLEFVVQLHASAFLLAGRTKRPLPRMAAGVGAWQEISGWLMWFAVPNTAFLVAGFGDIFRNAPVLAKVSGAILFCAAAALVAWITEAVCPPSDGSEKLMTARRRCVERAVMLARKGGTEKDVPIASAEYAAEMARGDWASLPGPKF